MVDKISGNFIAYDRNRREGSRLTEIDLAPSGHVGIKCELGHWALPATRDFGQFKNWRRNYWCDRWDEAPANFDLPALQEKSARYLAMGGAADILGTTWFHSSLVDYPDFQRSLTRQEHIHVGTRAAAIDWELIQARGFASSFLYEISLLPGSEICPEIYVERDGDADLETLYGTLNKFAIYRYVNVKEDPGAISLIIDPAAIASVCQIAKAPQGARTKMPLPVS